MDAPSSGFNPNSYSDTPLYNIQAVAAATGVPAITLRSWERRYGVPEPKRDPKGYRLYSERDIALTRWLKDRVQQGVGISRAVNMLRVIEQSSAAPIVDHQFDFASLRDRLLEGVRRLDEVAVNRALAEGLVVASVEDVALELIQPVLYQIGDLWACGQISVTTEHIASNLIRIHLAQLVRISPAPLRPERIVVGCAPYEQHDMGALMLTLFLRRRGYGVTYAGANVEQEDFIQDVLRLQPAAACLSAGSPHSARALAALFAVLRREYEGLLCYGGRAFNGDEALRRAAVGLYLGEDAADSTRRLEELLSSALSPTSVGEE